MKILRVKYTQTFAGNEEQKIDPFTKSITATLTDKEWKKVKSKDGVKEISVEEYVRPVRKEITLNG